MKLVYFAEIKTDEDGRYFVSFPDLEEAITEGETLEEALFNAQEVLTLTLESRVDEGLEIPEPREHMNKSFYQVAPASRVQAAILMRLARQEKNKSLSELARILKTSWPAVQRLENPHHSPNLKRLDQAAAALGKNLVLSLE